MHSPSRSSALVSLVKTLKLRPEDNDVLKERAWMELFQPTSLTDQYLADLDDLDDSDGADVAAEIEDVEEEDHDEEFDEEACELSGSKELSTLTKLFGSDRLKEHMVAIKKSMARASPAPNTREHAEDYELVVVSNDIVYELENETIALTKYIRDAYAPRFPELEALIQNPLDYVRTVRRIGNEMDITQVELGGVLPSATIMVVSVTATTTTGGLLPVDTLNKVMAACDQALELDDTRQQILHFIETRMNILAPNLTYVVGSSVAALMMSAAGGLQELSRMPACNIQMIGAKRKVVNGMSTAALGTRGGVINQSPLVLNSPPDYRQKAVKLVAAKCTLAARVDASNDVPSGEVGIRFKKQVEGALTTKDVRIFEHSVLVVQSLGDGLPPSDWALNHQPTGR